MSSALAPAKHPWKFVRLGGLDQVLIENAADLRALATLDQKLWVALSCPVKGLELDEKSLALIDRDGDGRIRVPEILEAIRWAGLHLADVGDLLTARDHLPLTAINPATPDGQRTLASAKAILQGLGKPADAAVTLAQAADTVNLFSATTLNGDGIIIPGTAGDDAATKQLITDILATLGGVTDRSGQLGVDQTHADTFFAACAACRDWQAQGETPAVLTLGDATAAAATAVAAVHAKVDDFFARVQLADFDARALAALNRSESDYLALAAQDLTITAEELVAFPLNQVAPGQPLALTAGVNPGWAVRLATLLRDAITPVFGPDQLTLTAAQWIELKTRVAPYHAWVAAKAGAAVEKLGAARIEAILAGPGRETIATLIARDKALEAEFDAIHGVERLCRYTRDFRSLLRNFVNFLDFYSPDLPAIFQAGTLYLDSRSTEFCIEVAGPSPLAAMSKAYIAYCDLTRQGKTRKIAACFTQGDSDYLFVGRNGIFYDRRGNDWDARIIAVVDNPISVRQAFFLPYKKFVRFIEEQAAKRAAAAEAKADAKLSTAAIKAADAATAATAGPAAKRAEPKKVDIGAVAAIGVAVSGAVTALTLILGYVFGLAAWQYPLVLGGLMLVISGPSMLIAWLKLRQRTLGPILEANGWAINGRVNINVKFGTRLTSRAILPAGSSRSLKDPYANEDVARRARLITVLIFIGLIAGIRLHAVHLNDGRYFWQSPPAPPAPAVAAPVP